jgi:hypothetical protein
LFGVVANMAANSEVDSSADLDSNAALAMTTSTFVG